MKEKLVTQYIAEDGKVFETKEKCLAYEEKRKKDSERLKEIPELRKALHKIKQICKDINCLYCPFNNDDRDCCFPYESHSPRDWDIPED